MMDGDWYAPDATTFGDRLAGAREAVGLDQRALAGRVGVRLKTLRAWEEDRAEPRANRLSVLAGVLGVSLPWLLTGAGRGPGGGGDLSAEVAELRRVAATLAGRLEQLEARLRAEEEAPLEEGPYVPAPEGASA